MQALEAVEKTHGDAVASGEVNLDTDASSLTVAQLQAELTKLGLATTWNPLKGKKELVERLQVRLPAVR